MSADDVQQNPHSAAVKWRERVVQHGDAGPAVGATSEQQGGEHPWRVQGVARLRAKGVCRLRISALVRAFRSAARQIPTWYPCLLIFQYEKAMNSRPI